MIVVVLKTSLGNKPGDLADASEWRNRERQLRCRQLRPASSSECALYESGVRNIHDKRDVSSNKGRVKTVA